jgi:hypothetical protein
VARLRVGDSFGHVQLMLGEHANSTAVALSVGEALIVTSDAMSTALKSSLHMPQIMAAALAADENIWRIHEVATSVSSTTSSRPMDPLDGAAAPVAQASLAIQPNEIDMTTKICTKYDLNISTVQEVEEWEREQTDATIQPARSRSLERRGSYVFKVGAAGPPSAVLRRGSMYIADSALNQVATAASPSELLALADRLCGEGTWVAATAMYLCGLHAATHYKFSAAVEKLLAAHRILGAARYAGPYAITPWASIHTHIYIHTGIYTHKHIYITYVRTNIQAYTHTCRHIYLATYSFV